MDVPFLHKISRTKSLSAAEISNLDGERILQSDLVEVANEDDELLQVRKN